MPRSLAVSDLLRCGKLPLILLKVIATLVLTSLVVVITTKLPTMACRLILSCSVGMVSPVSSVRRCRSPRRLLSRIGRSAMVQTAASGPSTRDVAPKPTQRQVLLATRFASGQQPRSQPRSSSKPGQLQAVTAQRLHLLSPQEKCQACEDLASTRTADAAGAC